MAQMVPDAPVLNFRLPMFGDNGYPTWDLRGAEGRYISPEQVDVTGMRLLVFDEDQPNRVEAEIISPEATMLIREHQARGDRTITVVGDNFVVRGEHWLWEGPQKEGPKSRVVIDDNVKVTFFEELSGILK